MSRAKNTSFGKITSVSATVVSACAAALGAMAAAASAFASYRAVALTHRPYIAAVWEVENAGDRFILTVSLTNEGPGTAVNVRCRVRSDVDPVSEWSDPVYALSPGRSDCRKFVQAGRLEEWFVETKFNDIRGATWIVGRKSAKNRDRRSRRIRSGKLDFWRPTGLSTAGGGWRRWLPRHPT